MKPTVLVILLVSVISFHHSFADTLAGDSKGTNFWLAFPANNLGGAPELSLYISSDTNATGVVTISGLGFSTNFAVTANGVTTVPLPMEAILASDGSIETTENVGVHVTASDRVAVYGMDRKDFTTDGFAALPVNLLGTNYLALTYTNYNPELAVVATASNTVVTIIPTATVYAATNIRSAGVAYSINLNPGQAYELAAPNADLSGSSITANQPIAVLSGNTCTFVPLGVQPCDHVIEQIPPVSAWGGSFVALGSATRAADLYRVLAANDNTQVEFAAGNDRFSVTLNRGQIVDRIISNAVQITASAPVLVGQFALSQSYDNVPGDPFLMLIPPVNQFLSRYAVMSLTNAFYDLNFLNVVVPTGGVSGVTLDGAAVAVTNFAAVGSSGFSGARLRVSRGPHTIVGTQPFGLFVYGFSTNNYESYGYFGGLSVNGTADISLRKTHSGTFTNGSTATFTLTVSNAGPAATIAPITVTDTLPGGLTYNSGTGTGWNLSVAGQTITGTYSNALAASQASSFNITVNVGVAAVPSVTNSASVAYSGDGLAGNNTVSDAATVNRNAAECTFSLSPSTESFPVRGGSSNVVVNTLSGCVWSASSSVPWITITSGTAGTGSGSVGFCVGANTGTTPRTGTVTVAGQILTINQAASAGNCDWSSDLQLMTGNAGYSDVALDDTFAYFGDNYGNIKRVPKGGGSIATIATFPGNRVITGVAVDETNVYFGVCAPLPAGYSGNIGTIASVPKAGGTIVTLTTNATNVVLIRADASHLYWNSYGYFPSPGGYPTQSGFIARVPKAGGSVERLATNLASCYGFALDATDIYFGESGYVTSGTTNGSIKKLAKSGGTATQLYTGVAGYITFDASAIYSDTLFGGELFKIPKAGGARTVLASGLVFPDQLIVDNGQLYFNVDGNCGAGGFLGVIDVNTGNSQIVKSSLACALPMALDNCAVYVMSKAGSIGSLDRIARPVSVPAPSTFFTFSSGSYSVDETGYYVNIDVRRTGQTNFAASVNYAITDGTATAGSDYSATSGKLDFAAGETNKIFSLFITDDQLAEGNETVLLALSNPSVGTVLGSPSNAVLTIVDNDQAGPGKPDVTFSNAVGSAYSGTVRGVGLQSDGRIYIGGEFTTVNGATRNYLARLNTNGSLDASFDPGTGASSYVETLAVQSDDKVVIGGWFSTYGGNPAKYVCRVQTNGALDTNFVAAVVTNWFVNTLSVQPDGKVLVGGQNFGTYTNLARLNANGSKDATFTPTTNGANGNIYAVVQDAAGKVLVGGNFTRLSDTPRNGLGRLNGDGSVDSGFDPNIGGTVYCVLALSNGQILIGGSFTNVGTSSVTNLARLNANGTCDSSFTAPTNINQAVYAIAMQPDTKLLIGGAFNVYGAKGNYLLRLNPNGTVDPTFDTGTGPNSTVYSIVLQRDNKILIGGAFTTVNGVARRFIARLENDAAASMPLFKSISMTNGQPRFTFSAAQGSTSIVEATTTFTNWTPLQTNVAGAGDSQFIDTNSQGLNRRFYRVRQ